MEEAVSPPLLQDIFEAQGATALAWRGSSALDRRRRIARLREAVLDRREDWYRAAY